MREAPRSVGRRVARAALHLAIGSLLLGSFAASVDLAAAAALFRKATLLPLVLGLAALALDFWLRAVRFWIMLRAATGRPLAFGEMVAPFVASFGINDLVPLRIGDGLRVLWLSRRHDIPPGAVTGALIVERLFDLAAIFVLAAIAGFGSLSTMIGGEHRGLLLLGVASVAALALLSYAGLRRLSTMRAGGGAAMARVRAFIASAAVAIRRLGSRRCLAGSALLSLGAWLCEASLLLCAQHSLGAAIGLSPMMLAFAAATLASMIPGLPGQFGTFEVGGLYVLTLYGMHKAMAAAVILLAHLLLWAPTAIFSMLWLLARSLGRDDPLAHSRDEPFDGLRPEGAAA